MKLLILIILAVFCLDCLLGTLFYALHPEKRKPWDYPDL